jgi:hypothetical protein
MLYFFPIKLGGLFSCLFPSKRQLGGCPVLYNANAQKRKREK